MGRVCKRWLRVKLRDYFCREIGRGEKREGKDRSDEKEKGANSQTKNICRHFKVYFLINCDLKIVSFNLVCDYFVIKISN